MNEYYIHNGTSQEGPFDLERLKQLGINKETPIWYEGLQGWTTAGEVESLSELFMKATPPPFFTSTPPPFEFSVPPAIEKREKKPVAWMELIQKNRTAFIAVIAIIACIVIGSLFVKNSNREQEVVVLNQRVEAQENAASEEQQKEEVQAAQAKKANDALTAKNMNIRNNWEQFVHVDYDAPTVNYALGGISEFSVYLENTTPYMLEQVNVLVEYIRKNGNLYQTKTVSFYNIPAGSTDISVAPSSVNGVSVRCTITEIMSKKLHFCYPYDNGNPKDPYFCK
jgi:hypothetical protein